jgi:hypothetical protein
MSAFSDWNGPGGYGPSPFAKEIKEIKEKLTELQSALQGTAGSLSTHISNVTDAHNLVARFAAAKTAAEAYAQAQANAARNAAIQAASTDATSKANTALNTSKNYTDSEIAKLSSATGAITTAVKSEAQLRAAADNALNDLIAGIKALIDTVNAELKIDTIVPKTGTSIDIKAILNTLDIYCNELYLKYKMDFVQFKYVSAVAYASQSEANPNYVLIIGRLSETFKPQIFQNTTVRPKPCTAFVKWVNSKPWNAIVDMSATISNDGADRYTGAISALCSKTSDRTTPITFGLYHSTTTAGDHHIYLGVQVEDTSGLIISGGHISGMNFYVAGINFEPLQADFPAGSVTLITQCSIYSDGEFGVNAISVAEWLRTNEVEDKDGNAYIKIDDEYLYIGDPEDFRQIKIYSTKRPTVTHVDLDVHQIAYLSDLSQSIYWQRTVAIATPDLATLEALLLYYILIDPQQPDTPDNRKIVSPDYVGALSAPGFYDTMPYSTGPTGYFFTENDVALLQSYILDDPTHDVATEQVVDGHIGVELTATPEWYPITTLSELDPDYIIAAGDDPNNLVNATTVRDNNGAIGKIISILDGNIQVKLSDDTHVFAYTVPAYITFVDGAWAPATTDPIPVPKTFDNAVHDISYEWSGAHIAETQNNTGAVKYYVESYITWTVHHENNKGMRYSGNPWDSVDLPLEGYRSAAKQDEIDANLEALASVPADYAEQRTVIERQLPGQEAPKIIANPAYIHSRPWTGIAVLDSGAFTPIPSMYAAWLVDGGDFSITTLLPGTATPPVPAENQFRNVIFRLWRGKYEDMPELSDGTDASWLNYANTLRWCTDTAALWFSDGQQLHHLLQSFKVIWTPSTNWEWIKTEQDGGGHFYWSAADTILRFDGPNADDGPIVWEEYAINGGAPGYDITGGTRIGTRLITAKDVNDNDIIKRYYTKNTDSATFTAADEISTVGELNEHINDKNNPHEVTAEQVGLGNVDNTADLAKPVSFLVQEAIDNAQLASQTWLAAVQTEADLPDPPPDVNKTYLCKVQNDPDSTKIGTWQWIPDGAGSGSWSFFEGTEDFVTEQELTTAITTATTATLTDAAASNTLPAITSSTWSALMQTVRNCLKWLVTNMQTKLNRTIYNDDSTTGSVTDTGGNINVPIQLTTVAPAASSTQTTASTSNLRAKFKVLVDNIAYLFANKEDKLTYRPVLIADNYAGGNGGVEITNAFNVGDRRLHIVDAVWSYHGYSGTVYHARYAIKTWNGGSTTSGTIWTLKIAGNNSLSFANGGANKLVIKAADGETSNYDMMVWFN